jgi:hypothetical protein
MCGNPLQTIFCIVLRSRHQSGVNLRGMIRNRVWKELAIAITGRRSWRGPLASGAPRQCATGFTDE